MKTCQKLNLTIQESFFIGAAAWKWSGSSFSYSSDYIAGPNIDGMRLI